MTSLVAETLAELEALGSAELRTRWLEIIGRPAPRHMSLDLLLRALAYQVQEQTEGGLSRAALKRLAALADPDGKVGPRPPAPRLKSGTRLVREWRGEVHQVTVLDEGFDYRGERYGSLSLVARTITGTRWSGPAFFGLRKTGGRSGADSDV